MKRHMSYLSGSLLVFIMMVKEGENAGGGRFGKIEINFLHSEIPGRSPILSHTLRVITIKRGGQA